MILVFLFLNVKRASNTCRKPLFDKDVDLDPLR